MVLPFSFRAFTTQFNGTALRITTDVWLSQPFDPRNPPDPLPDRIKKVGLWDTGATGSCISPAVAAELGLVAVSQINVDHGGGTGVYPRHIVNLYLPNDVTVVGALVTAMPFKNFDVVIGMDIIGHGDLAITNVGGKTCFSFRIPSCEKIDYVDQIHKAAPKVGRNDPCPCGAAKKYKHCHGSGNPPI